MISFDCWYLHLASNIDTNCQQCSDMENIKFISFELNPVLKDIYTFLKTSIQCSNALTYFKYFQYSLIF